MRQFFIGLIEEIILEYICIGELVRLLHRSDVIGFQRAGKDLYDLFASEGMEKSAAAAAGVPYGCIVDRGLLAERR